VIVPVPLYSRREREREFNQSAVLCDELGAKLGALVSKRTLRRTRDTPSQTGLKKPDRVENQRGAFAVSNPGRIAGREVILVDDVWTTGATTEECARTLLQAGAKKVLVLTAARG